MAYELFLVRFDTLQPLQRKALIEDLRRTAFAIVPTDDPLCKVSSINRGSGSFRVALRGSEVTVRVDLVDFLIDHFEAQTIPLIYALAKCGDFVVENARGTPGPVLTNSAQFKLLPPELRDPKPAICTSEKQLASLLGVSPRQESRRASHQKSDHYKWSGNHKDRRFGRGDPTPELPGLQETPTRPVLFLQLKPNEGPLLLMDKFGEFLKARKRLGLPLPGGGGVGNSDWLLHTPAGETFVPWSMTGYDSRPNTEHLIPVKIEAWRAILLDFARQTGRATGTVTAGKQFVLGSGKRHPLGGCESRRTTDDEG